MLPIVRSIQVWVRVPINTTQGAEFAFPDISELRGCVVTGIAAPAADTIAFTPDLTPVVTSADQAFYSVTLNKNSLKLHKDVPIAQFNTTRNSGLWVQFRPFKWDQQKSRLRFVGATPTEANASVPFWVHYVHTDDMERFPEYRQYLTE